MIQAVVRATAIAGKRRELQETLKQLCRDTEGYSGFGLYQSSADEDAASFFVTSRARSDGRSMSAVLDAVMPLCERAGIELRALGGASNGEGTNGRALRRAVLHEERVVRKAESYMRAHLHEDLTVAQVAAVTSVSTRTLFRSFQKYRRYSPMKFLERVRLENVRNHLLRGRNGHTISRVAADSGFTHLSRFSGLYKRTYGELPSETRRRPSARSTTT